MKRYELNMQWATNKFFEYVRELNLSEEEHKEIARLLFDVKHKSILYGYSEGLEVGRKQEYTAEKYI